MSLTVRELLLNHTRGISSNVKSNEGQYFDTEIPHFDDITEMIKYKEELVNKMENVKEIIQEENKAKQKALTLEKAEKRMKYLKDLKEANELPKLQLEDKNIVKETTEE